jgi:bifunctional UDP-N-acetylglucosamine pyrophosphorylase / glucosamine-1-phosphate N-acetyltransferase
VSVPPAVAAVVLAAGRGTRMHSALPKVLHEAAGVPLLGHVLAALEAGSPVRRVVVVGHGADAVRERFGRRDDGGRPGREGVEFALQSEQLGTADALRAAGAVLGAWPGTVLVANGDDVLLRGETVRRLLEAHHRGGAGMSLITTEVDEPTGLGRVVRDAGGGVRAIVEERDADDATRALHEVNPGLYAFDGGVWSLLEQLGRGNAAGEYYLTDMVAAYIDAGLPVRGVESGSDPAEPIGVNDRAQLAHAERFLRERVRRRWLEAGVTMHDPSTTFVDGSVELAPDVVLEVGVVLRGTTRVGEGARIGAYAVLEDCEVQPGAAVAPHTVERGERRAGERPAWRPPAWRR